MVSDRLRAYSLVLGAATCWGGIGTAYALIRARVAIAPVTLVFVRAVAAFLLLLLVLLLARRDLLRVRARDLSFLALFGLSTVSLFYVALIYAYELAGVALATILLYLGPAFVTVGAALGLGEPLTRRKGLALGLCLLGAALAIEPWRGDDPRSGLPGLALGLLSALAYAAASLLGKPALRLHPPPTLLLYALGFGALGLLPAHLLAGSSLPALPALLAVALATGLPITLLPYILYLTALARLPAGSAAIAATFEPVVALALAALVLGQPVGAPQLAGAALIVGGVIVLASGTHATRGTPTDV